MTTKEKIKLEIITRLAKDIMKRDAKVKPGSAFVQARALFSIGVTDIKQIMEG